ncbi:MAG: 30S ribosomal protein THX [Bacteroidales bacterium]|nr:30S ribosomal protein THX [Bacteroidales bacterium]MDZ4203741.1 30S ribosomal protein THX [Bacteroidales bacterium]
MGKGDKKSRRGKIILGSYGVRRPRRKPGYQHTSKPVEKILTDPPEVMPIVVVEASAPPAIKLPTVVEAKKKTPAKKTAKSADAGEAEKPKRKKKETPKPGAE